MSAEHVENSSSNQLESTNLLIMLFKWRKPIIIVCAAAAVLDPEVQLVITLQSYNEEAIKPVKFALVAVCAVEKLVQVDDEFNL